MAKKKKRNPNTQLGFAFVIQIFSSFAKISFRFFSFPLKLFFLSLFGPTLL
jgi:hypothetical protein